jgi:phosphatidylserine/phosphatidylglycerophosphate/cardiolipin synthase-like enzyme
MSSDFQVTGTNKAALFSLKIHRGDGMALLAMNWKKGQPPADFVGFAIEYKEPGGSKFFALKNRLSFPKAGGAVDPNILSTLRSPIQKFRWVHFPRNADLDGDFTYRVAPVFMNDRDELSYGDSQVVAIELRRDTYPGKLNVAFTRGFVSSQAFVDRYESVAPISSLIPDDADKGLGFVPTHPNAKEALAWMGFEARQAILDVLDQAIADKKAQVRVIAYDLNEPDVVSRLEQLGSRLKILIDDSSDHGIAGSGESQAAQRLALSAGEANVRRQHMGQLQHNKTIVVEGPKVKAAVCGSTNYSWRGFFVQANNAVVLYGKNAIKPFAAAFEDYWNNETPGKFANTGSATWTSLGLDGINAKVAFSPHSTVNAALQSVADDIGTKTTSSLFYSLAFLYQTPGVMLDAIKKVSEDNKLFVYGISDRKVGGIDLQKPEGNISPVFPSALGKNLPEPFKSEPTGGSGNRMHHKFLVVDFNKPTARVYVGSYNFSGTADTKNGENLLLIRNRRIAVSYMIEALRLVDHYHFRVAQQEAKSTKTRLQLAKPPRLPGETPWWSHYYSNALKIRDRQLFA